MEPNPALGGSLPPVRRALAPLAPVGRSGRGGGLPSLGGAPGPLGGPSEASLGGGPLDGPMPPAPAPPRGGRLDGPAPPTGSSRGRRMSQARTLAPPQPQDGGNVVAPAGAPDSASADTLADVTNHDVQPHKAKVEAQAASLETETKPLVSSRSAANSPVLSPAPAPVTKPQARWGRSPDDTKPVRIVSQTGSGGPSTGGFMTTSRDSNTSAGSTSRRDL
eukprot:COSAG05_NODE_214_length_13907_cov_28.992178_8_plen_220_part_00